MDSDEVTVYCRGCGGYGTVGAAYVWLLPKCPGCRAELIVGADAATPLDWRPVWERPTLDAPRLN
jgi:hypothetical protein